VRDVEVSGAEAGRRREKECTCARLMLRVTTYLDMNNLPDVRCQSVTVRQGRGRNGNSAVGCASEKPLAILSDGNPRQEE
jgi:hypothetical protein